MRHARPIPITVMTACLALAIVVGTLTGCTRTVYVSAGAHSLHHAGAISSPSPSLPPGVKDGSSPGTYYVDCSVQQCTTETGAGPFGTTCSAPSTDEQFCSPDLTPSPTTPPPQSGPVTIDCLMGYVNIPAGSGVAVQEKKFQLTPPKPDTADGYSLSDYKAMRVSITVSQDITINTVTVVWYGSSGQEISSGSVDIGQLITAGQTLTYINDESTGSDPNPRAGATTCTAPYYS